MLKLKLQHFGHLMFSSQHTGKDPDAMKDGRQEKKGMTEDKMVGWHHRLNRHEFDQTPGDGRGQGSLVCCSSWGHKDSDMTEWTTTLLKHLLNRILQPSISRLKMSGNSYFGRAWLGPQSTDCGSNQKWLARPPSDSLQSFGAQGQLSLRETLMTMINLTACRSWGEFYTLDHITSLFKGEGAVTYARATWRVLRKHMQHHSNETSLKATTCTGRSEGLRTRVRSDNLCGREMFVFIFPCECIFWVFYNEHVSLNTVLLK